MFEHLGWDFFQSHAKEIGSQIRSKCAETYVDTQRWEVCVSQLFLSHSRSFIYRLSLALRKMETHSQVLLAILFILTLHSPGICILGRNSMSYLNSLNGENSEYKLLKQSALKTVRQTLFTIYFYLHTGIITRI